MKGLFVLALTLTVVAVVYGDSCSTTQDCVNAHITSCSHHTHVVCESSQCHCTGGPSGNTCSAKSDCTCNRGNPHCVDGQCHCTRI